MHRGYQGKGAGMNREDIIRMAREAGYSDSQDWSVLVLFAALVAAAEREACAKVCEELRITGLMLDAYSCNEATYKCADAIRARGQV